MNPALVSSRNNSNMLGKERPGIVFINGARKPRWQSFMPAKIVTAHFLPVRLSKRHQLVHALIAVVFLAFANTEVAKVRQRAAVLAINQPHHAGQPLAIAR